MAGSRREAPRIALPLVLLAVVMIGAGVFRAVDAIGDDRRRERAEQPAAGPTLERVRSTVEDDDPGDPPAIDLDRRPTAYRLRTLIRRAGTADTIEDLAVDRPFTSRRVTRSAPDAPVTEEETSFGRIATGTGSATPQVIATTPTPADDRIDAILEDALEAGVLVAREERRVAGERCRVVRSGASRDVLDRPTPTSYVDTCVSADGLVLERWTVEGGRPVEQRVVTNVDREPSEPLTPRLPTEPTLDINTGGGFVRRADPTSEPPGEFVVLDAPPDGFTFEGRFTVIPAQAALSDPEQRDAVVAGTTDVYRRDGDVILLDRGATRGTVRVFEPHPQATAVDLGPLLGPGEALTTWRGSEVRVTRPGGRFVRISGTVPLAQLQELARALRQTPGGDGLRYLE